MSRESYERLVDLWDDPARTREQPYFGWLSNTIAGYPETLNIPANVITADLDLRPQIVLDSAVDHELVREQRLGISLDRARELAEFFMHRSSRV